MGNGTACVTPNVKKGHQNDPNNNHNNHDGTHNKNNRHHGTYCPTTTHNVTHNTTCPDPTQGCGPQWGLTRAAGRLMPALAVRRRAARRGQPGLRAILVSPSTRMRRVSVTVTRRGTPAFSPHARAKTVLKWGRASGGGGPAQEQQPRMDGQRNQRGA